MNGVSDRVKKSFLMSNSAKKCLVFWSPKFNDNVSANYFNKNKLPRFNTDPKSQLEKGLYYCEIIKETKGKGIKKVRSTKKNGIIQENNESFLYEAALNNITSENRAAITNHLQHETTKKRFVTIEPPLGISTTVTSESNEGNCTAQQINEHARTAETHQNEEPVIDNIIDYKLLYEQAERAKQMYIDLYTAELALNKNMLGTVEVLEKALEDAKKRNKEKQISEENKILKEKIKNLTKLHERVEKENSQLTHALKRAVISDSLPIILEEESNIPDSYVKVRV